MSPGWQPGQLAGRMADRADDRTGDEVTAGGEQRDGARRGYPRLGGGPA
jgi:hypothetical protein